MSETPIAVLHVAQPTDGGVARYVIDLARDQAGRGWRVAVACPDGGLADQLGASGVPRLRWSASRSPGPAVPLETFRLARLVRSFDPELVHLHSAKAGLAGRLALRGRRTTVFQPHAWSFEAADGPVRAAATAWERLAARWAHAIVCVSDAERSRGMRAGINGPLRVVTNGVDLTALRAADEHDRAAARSRLSLAAHPMAVCVGRLARQKGQDVLVRSWPLVCARIPDAELVLVGDGPDHDTLEDRAGQGVRLVGARDDVEDWLAAADVVVSASRWDGLSLVLLEALARGRSIVATDVTGAREAVGEEAGALVPPEDHCALAAAIVDRLVDAPLRAAEERAARARAETLFDLRRTLAETIAIYRDALSSSSRGG